MQNTNIYDSLGEYLSKQYDDNIPPEDLYNRWTKQQGIYPETEDAFRILKIIQEAGRQQLNRQLTEIYGGNKYERRDQRDGNGYGNR